MTKIGSDEEKKKTTGVGTEIATGTDAVMTVITLTTEDTREGETTMTDHGENDREVARHDDMMTSNVQDTNFFKWTPKFKFPTICRICVFQTPYRETPRLSSRNS